MKTLEFTIEGMSCSHCVMAVKKELSALDGVTVNEVVIGRAKVTADETKAGAEKLTQAIEEAGYSVSAVKQEESK
ncbi:MAG: Mercuric transport protein periplasmic component [Ignavibacteriaceae bacterium]|nr:Mercuric transport protein periplasmic component [Ignavibacteriaceae bacterium]